MFFAASGIEKCVALREARIEVLCINPEYKERRVSMAKMKVVQVPKPGADFEIVEREIPQPSAGTCVFACRLAAFATATVS